MVVPASAKIFTDSMDPYDIVDFKVDVGPLLESTEGVATYQVTIPTESSLFGLEIQESAGYGVTITGNVITFYLGIATAEQANPVYNAGVTLPVEISLTTDSVPPRRKQRTVAVKVIQR